MKKALIAIALITLLILLVGCSDSDNNSIPPISQKTNSNASGNHKSAGAQFVDCLKANNVKIYSLTGCKPCHDNVEEVFNQLAANRKFSGMSDFQSAVTSFMAGVYNKCGSRCYVIQTPFTQSNGVYSVQLNETTTPSSGCTRICTVNGSNISGFPTWTVNNQVIGDGKLSLSLLSSKTGCNWR